MTKRDMLTVIRDKYCSERATKVLNLDILLSARTSIPEHTDFTLAVDELVSQIAELEDKIEVIDNLLTGDFKNV